MATSRLRLRLASGFALAFAIGLALLTVGALGYLNRESRRRLDGRLDATKNGVLAALLRERTETPDSSLAFAAREVAAEWPPNGDAFVLLDDRNMPLAAVDADSSSPRVIRRWHDAGTARFSIDDGGLDLRVTASSATLRSADRGAALVTVLAFSSTEGIEGDTQMLGLVLAIASPLILLTSLVAGYVVAGRALAPVTSLAQAIAAIAPSDLSRRLHVTSPPDEVSRLAEEFNALLDRLEQAQHSNRGFVREAAHQIRTPLTLVLGEAAHALDSPSSEQRTRATLGRIRTAAEHMRRRVDELFLLAEARSGEAVRLNDHVELDGLLLECTDLVRARASALGRTLAIGRAEPLVVVGNAALLQEALLELLENACRHGHNSAPVTASCFRDDERFVMEVANDGAVFTLPTGSPERQAAGIGLSVVQWIAHSHHGTLSVQHQHGHNCVRLSLPPSDQTIT